nr:hypothetical protein BaRGS_013669 [Batillaria attramentaria]
MLAEVLMHMRNMAASQKSPENLLTLLVDITLTAGVDHLKEAARSEIDMPAGDRLRTTGTVSMMDTEQIKVGASQTWEGWRAEGQSLSP